MKIVKKITVGDRRNPSARYVIEACKSEARFLCNRAGYIPVGEENLICEEELDLIVHDGKKEIGFLTAFVWHLPTMNIPPEFAGRAAASFRQQTINQLIALMYDKQVIESKILKYDNTQMVSAVTQHLHITNLFVEPEYRNSGLATRMLDFAQALINAKTISLLNSRHEMENTTSGWALSQLGFHPVKTMDALLASQKRTLYVHLCNTNRAKQNPSQKAKKK